MAAEGTTIPGDAGQQRLNLSLPRPDQINPDPTTYSHTNPTHAAGNAFDIPRGTAEGRVTDEFTTATGGQTPSSIEKKTFDDAGDDPRAESSARYYKHTRQANDFDNGAETGHGLQAAPREEVSQGVVGEKGR